MDGLREVTVTLFSLSSTHVDDLDRDLSVSELQAKLYIYLIYHRLLMTSIDEASCLLVVLRIISVFEADYFCEDLWR